MHFYGQSLATMSNILVSWYAYNNDFMIEQRGNQRREMGLVNETGPTFTVHKHFWEDSRYDKHIILYSGDKKDDIEKLDLLVSELNNQFKKHIIITKQVLIDDPINVSEIFSKLQLVLAELTNDKTEIFISPGTPAMQTAWYLLGTHFKNKVTLCRFHYSLVTNILVDKLNDKVNLIHAWYGSYGDLLLHLVH